MSEQHKPSSSIASSPASDVADSGGEQSSMRHTTDAAPEHHQALTHYIEEEEDPQVERKAPKSSAIWTAHNTLPEQALGTVLSRSYQLGSFSWATTDAFGVDLAAGALDFPTALFSQPQILTKMGYFQYFRCESVTIEIKINATHWHYGGLIISHTVDNTDKQHQQTQAAFPNAQFCNNMPVLLSASQADTIRYTLPWCFPKPWMEISPGSPGANPSGAWKVAITVLFPLLMIGGVATDAKVVVMANFNKPELQFPNFLAITAPLFPESLIDRKRKLAGKKEKPVRPFQSKRVPRHKNTVTGQSLRSVAQGEARSKSSSGTIGGDPVHEIADAVFKVADAGEAIAPLAEMAFDKPISLMATNRVIVQPGYDLPLTKGLDSSMYLGADPEGSVVVDNGSTSADMSDPSLLAMQMMPGIVTVSSFTTTAAAGDSLGSWEVHPLALSYNGYLGVGASTATPSFLSWFTAPFFYWRGGIRFHFRFITSPLVTARVRFVWFSSSVTPPATLSDSYTGDFISRMYDITGDTEVDFIVPWMSDLWYRYVVANGGPPWGFSGRDSNGTLAMYLSNSIVSQSVAATPTIYYALWASAAPDFQVSGYAGQIEADGTTWTDILYEFQGANPSMTNNLKKWEKRSPVVPTPNGVEGQASIWAEFEQPSQPIIQSSSFVEAGYCSSETYSTILSCARRYSSFPLNTQTANSDVYNMQFWYPGTGAIADVSIAQYFTACHVYFRGSVRQKALWLSDSTVSHTITLPSVSGWTFDDDPWTGTSHTSFNPTIQLCAADTTQQNLLEFNIPWVSPLPYLKIDGKISLDYIDTGDPDEYLIFMNPLLRLPVQDTVVGTTVGRYWTAVGDDFSVGYIEAPPLVSWESA